MEHSLVGGGAQPVVSIAHIENADKRTGAALQDRAGRTVWSRTGARRLRVYQQVRPVRDLYRSVVPLAGDRRVGAVPRRNVRVEGGHAVALRVGRRRGFGVAVRGTRRASELPAGA